jgi:hypothetical protein
MVLVIFNPVAGPGPITVAALQRMGDPKAPQFTFGPKIAQS